MWPIPSNSVQMKVYRNPVLKCKNRGDCCWEGARPNIHTTKRPQQQQQQQEEEEEEEQQQQQQQEEQEQEQEQQQQQASSSRGLL